MSSPFSNKTPESYFAGLRRKDSKNALTTCHGVTDKGRACRRALASPKNSSKFDGAVVITGNADDPAVFFCWQHKDQADAMLQGEGEGSVVSIKGRHSLEDAFRSLGLDDVDEEPEPRESPSPHRSPGLSPHIRIPEPLQTVANESEKSSPAFHEPLDVADRSNERQRNRRRRSDVREMGLRLRNLGIAELKLNVQSHEKARSRCYLVVLEMYLDLAMINILGEIVQLPNHHLKLLDQYCTPHQGRHHFVR